MFGDRERQEKFNKLMVILIRFFTVLSICSKVVPLSGWLGMFYIKDPLLLVHVSILN